MDIRGAASRLVVGSWLLALLAGCSPGAGLSSTPPTPARSTAPSAAAVTPPPIPAGTATPKPTPSVVVTTNVAYESSDPILAPGELDVYAPAKAGAWPVVVMFHGAPGSNPRIDRSGMRQYARRVADLGYVVFNVSWGQVAGATTDLQEPSYDYLLAVQSQAACAVEFARAHAAEYGGDPATMIAYGHSGGAHAAAMATFVRRQPGAGCLGGTTLGAIDALVTWEGNWLLSINGPDWNAALAADPRVMDAVTPWKYLAEHRDQKVVMLVSEDPNISLRSEMPDLVVERPVDDPWAADSWLAVRDPSGDLRRQLEANGALADGTIGFADAQQLLYSVLKAQGNPVSLDVMPESSHAWLAGRGWEVFLAAFQKAAAGD